MVAQTFHKVTQLRSNMDTIWTVNFILLNILIFPFITFLILTWISYLNEKPDDRKSTYDLVVKNFLFYFYATQLFGISIRILGLLFSPMPSGKVQCSTKV